MPQSIIVGHAFRNQPHQPQSIVGHAFRYQATGGAKRLQAEELPTPAKRARIEQLPSPIGSTYRIENGESWNPSAENLDISLDLLLNSANNWARTPETILQPVAIYESLSHH